MERVLLDPWEREEEEEQEAESPCCAPGTPPTSSRSPAAFPLGPGAGGTTSSSRKTPPGTSPGAPRPPGTSRPFSGREEQPGAHPCIPLLLLFPHPDLGPSQPHPEEQHPHTSKDGSGSSEKTQQIPKVIHDGKLLEVQRWYLQAQGKCAVFSHPYPLSGTWREHLEYQVQFGAPWEEIPTKWNEPRGGTCLGL